MMTAAEMIAEAVKDANRQLKNMKRAAIFALALGLAVIVVMLSTGCATSPHRTAGAVTLARVTVGEGATVTITVSDSITEAGKATDIARDAQADVTTGLLP